jgi:hypothetical protein
MEHVSDVVLKYFDWERKKYLDNPINEQVEVASLIGDVAASPSGKPAGGFVFGVRPSEGG